MFNNFNACQAKCIINFKKLKTKLLLVSEDIRFNKKCLNLDITPKYARIKIRNTSASAVRTQRLAERGWVNFEIRRLHARKNVINYQLYKAHLEFLNTVHPGLVQPTLQKINNMLWPVIIKKKLKLSRKIDHLIKTRKDLSATNDAKYQSCPHTFYTRLYNCTNITFTDAETNTLNKGLKFNLPNLKHNSLSRGILQSESIIKSIPEQDLRNDARSNIKRSYNKFTSNASIDNTTLSFKQDRKNLLSIKEKLNSNNAFVTKADKGNTVVVMYKDEYDIKVRQFLEDNNIIPLEKDPTPDFAKQINKTINESNSLLKSEISKRCLKPIKPRAPIFHGLPKIHKAGVPVRPVVDYTSAPGYRLAQKLERTIKAGIVLKENHSLKNTYEFIENTKNLKVPHNTRMASLDIVNMYANVPIDETLEIVEHNLIRSKVYNIEIIDDIMRLLRVVLRQNYFSFNDTFYHQKDGLAMGSPLSGLLADIYMNHFERKYILSNDSYKSKIVYYGRYVDDTFILFNGTTRQLDSMVAEVNKVHPNIKFTSEHEKDGHINFLDSTISRKDDSLYFNIYRKPTTTNMTIHSGSFHPTSQKMAAYNCFIYRALNFPLSTEDRKKEINIIKHIAVKNGYKSTIVDDLLRRHTMKTSLPRPPKETKKFIKCDFNNVFALTLSNVLRKRNINVAFSTSNNTFALLKSHNRQRTPLVDKSGVYKLSCGSCDKFYIGQTGRSFKIRFKEHLPKKHGSTAATSNYARHLSEEKHEYANFETNCRPLHICEKGPYMNTLEEYEIYKAYKLDPDNTLNDKLCFNTNALYDLCMEAEKEHLSHK